MSSTSSYARPLNPWQLCPGNSVNRPVIKKVMDIDGDTSCRPISLLSVGAGTLGKSLIPNIIANMTMEPARHRCKAQHSTVTVLQTLTDTAVKGFNQMTHPARTITGALHISKAFDTINIHTLFRWLMQTNMPGTIMGFIADDVGGCMACATYINHTAIQRKFKTGVPQGGWLSPTLLTFIL